MLLMMATNVPQCAGLAARNVLPSGPLMPVPPASYQSRAGPPRAALGALPTLLEDADGDEPATESQALRERLRDALAADGSAEALRDAILAGGRTDGDDNDDAADSSTTIGLDALRPLIGRSLAPRV